MEIYQAEEKYILTVRGGEFYTLKSDPEAIILSEKPVPVRRWTVPMIKEKLSNGDEVIVDTVFLEYHSGVRKVWIIILDYHREEPRYWSAVAEFFVSEEFVKEKINSFGKIKRVTEYSWDSGVPTWKEVHRYKYYRKVKEAENEKSYLDLSRKNIQLK